MKNYNIDAAATNKSMERATYIPRIKRKYLDQTF